MRTLEAAPFELFSDRRRLWPQARQSHLIRTACRAFSTEWAQYATASDVQNRAKMPSDNGLIEGVIEMLVADVTAIEILTIHHAPDVERRIRGHSDVIGTKTPGVRVKLK